MKKVILIATLAFSTVAGAQNNDYTVELSMFQGINTRVGMFDAQLSMDNGFYVNAGIYGMNHFFPDYTGGRADDYVNLFVGYQFNPITTGALAPLKVKLGTGFVGDGTGAKWTSPTILTMDAAYRGVLSYPLEISDQFKVSADIGYQYAIGSKSNLKYDTSSLLFVGLTSTWVIK